MFGTYGARQPLTKRPLLAVSFACVVAFLTSVVGTSRAATPTDANVVMQWTDATLQAIRDSDLGAPVTARALAIVETCMYDAWAAYDDTAAGTELGTALRRPLAERTQENKRKAISYAAYYALLDLFPVDANAVYRPLMRKFGYDWNNHSRDLEDAAGIANVACGAVTEFRHHDGANQLGDLAPGAYSDWTHYRPTNRPLYVGRATTGDTTVNLDHWQPLVFVDSSGNLEVQSFSGAQWPQVTPFALPRGDKFRRIVQRFGPARQGDPRFKEQAQELVNLSANLGDNEKMIAEYWQDGTHTEQPPGHWMRFAEFVSTRDRHSVDDDVKMFFALSNTMLDAGIAAWDAKRAFDSVRPITAIPVLFKGNSIRAWGGPGKGTVMMDGVHWLPYQLATRPTPAFPEFVSGHSAYSAAAAQVLLLFTGSDRFGGSVTFAPRSSRIEPEVTPANAVKLQWGTFTEAADEAGMSRRYGGIHFKAGDLAGRVLGRIVGFEAWEMAQSYFNGAPKANLAKVMLTNPRVEVSAP